MNNRILIVGAGFSGMWAAISAARLAHLNNRRDIEITVLAPQPELRVRPRFYEDKVATLVSPLLPLFGEIGVNFLQGYWISRPMPLAQFRTWQPDMMSGE